MENMNMADMFGRMMDLQKKMADAQDALADKVTTAEAGGGMIKVTVNGLMKVKSIKVDPTVVDPSDIELLEDLIVAGVNKAMDEAKVMAQQEMRNAAGGLMPPGMNMNDLGF
ncbi:MAG: YbaB/EbfC family nucleoid-associated protein [Bacteroidota bacterium]